MKRLMEFFEDGDGTLSAMRLVLILWMLTTLAVWTYLSLRSGTIQTIDTGTVALLSALLTGKVLQKFGEAKS